MSINNRYCQINLRFLQNKWKDVKGIWDSAMGPSLSFRSGTELPSNSRQGKYKSALIYSRTSMHDHQFKTPHFPGQNPLMILSHRSYYCVSHFFLFRPLCFISPFPRFISSPRAAPAKVASLLISPSAQSAMSPRSQGGCNCELQKKTNDKLYDGCPKNTN